jgi:predicted GTPase
VHTAATTNTATAQDTATECARLGFGEPIGVSAEHGDGIADLASMVSPHYSAFEERVAQLEQAGEIAPE